MSAAHDRIAAVRRLEDAGLSREAAEAVTVNDLEASGAGHDPLATKADLAALKSELTDRIQASERRTTAVIFAAAGLLFAALKLIP